MRRSTTLVCALTLLGACSSNGSANEGESSESGDSSGAEGAEGAESGAPPDPQDAIDEAKELLPDYLSLHTTVIARTCSPDEGVCHHAKEYPDLTTPQAMLGVVQADCNIALDDVIDTFNGCEREGDRLVILYGPNSEFTSEIAWIEPITDMGGSITGYTVELREPIPEDDNDAELDSVSIIRPYDDGEVTMGTLYGVASYQSGQPRITLENWDEWNDNQRALLDSGARGGDPNRDGVFGEDESSFQMFAPGSPDQSYLLGRMLGTVPGTPMPLANQAVSSAEMLALTCWIEGLSTDGEAGVYDLIDYDNCEAAANFGQSEPDSGHSFSQDVRPILDRCTAGGCHDAEFKAAELDLESDATWANLLAPSSQDPETPRVEPGNPTSSYLMTKLRGPGVSGLQMPRTPNGDGEPLSDADLAILDAWIIAGAPND